MCSIAAWCLEFICYRIYYFFSVMPLTDINVFEVVFILLPMKDTLFLEYQCNLHMYLEAVCGSDYVCMLRHSYAS